MTIGIDANEANIANRVGIGRFAYNVLLGINRIRDKNIDFQIYLKDKPLSDLPKASFNWQYQIFSPSFLWSQIALPIYLNSLKIKPDVLFSLSHYAPFLSAVPKIISIMDLSFLFYPKLFKKSDLIKLRLLTLLSVKRAKKIITISNFSKSEIIKYYSIEPEKIIVAYPGVEPNFYKPKKSFQKKDYILYVGTLQPRKNIKNLIETFSILRNNDKLHLKIVGQKGWLYQDIFNLVRNRGLESKIIFTDYVNENQLISFYQNAVCLVLPSSYEGFGIPVIEAFASGCPVIAANTSSLPEIVSNAGLLVNPYDTTSMVQAIDKVYSDKKLRQSLIKKGLARSKSFKWEKTSKIIYTTLIGSIKK